MDEGLVAPKMAAFRHRNRKINTCLECRRLKRRCDRERPCNHCQKTARECIFPGPGGSSATAESRTSDGGSSGATADVRPAAPSPPKAAAASAVRRGVPPRGRSTQDTCLQIGRMSMAERVGGLPRSDLVTMFTDILAQRTIDLEPTNFAAPIVAWVKPHATLPLGKLMSTSLPEENVEEETPFCSAAQRRLLVDRFFTAVFPMCPLVSRPELELEPPLNGGSATCKALRLAVLYAAASSLSLLDSQRILGQPRDSLVKLLKAAVEDALHYADVFNSFELASFQAILIYLTPQVLATVSRSHSIFLGALTRHFRMAGLDRDSPYDNDSQRETKRHLWQHILFLNLRATEAIGPERGVPEDPDAELPSDSSGDLILSRVRYECYRIHRRVFAESVSRNTGAKTFRTTLQVIDSLCQDVYRRYLDVLDDTVIIQKYTKAVGTILLARSQGMLLHGRWGSWRDRVLEPEIRERSIRSCLAVCETAMALETDPDLSHWAWYAGTYQQYQSSLPIISQVFLDPTIPTAGRIMSIADHVFGPSPEESPCIRSGRIIRETMDKMASFLAAFEFVVPERCDFRHDKSQANASSAEIGSPVTPQPNLVLPAHPFADSLVAGGGAYADPNLPFGPPGGPDLWWQWPPLHPLETPELNKLS